MDVRTQPLVTTASHRLRRIGGRIEASLETTFANLIELQVARLNLPRMPAPDFAVTAICRNLRAVGRSTIAAPDTSSRRRAWAGAFEGR